MLKFITFISFIALVAAQNTWTVLVAANKTSTFEPEFVFASIGDTVSFVFLAGNHTVTQSSFDTPCTEFSPEGIDSGFVPVPLTATTFQQFAFTLNSIQSPLWFYSRQTGDCALGMVFAVNPSDNESFEAFQANANAIANSPIRASGPLTVLPIPITVSLPFTGTTTASVTPTTIPITSIIPSPTPLPSGTSPFASPSVTSAKTHRNVITGAIIGGFLSVVMMVFAFFYLKRRRRTAKELGDGFGPGKNFFFSIVKKSSIRILPFTLTAPDAPDPSRTVPVGNKDDAQPPAAASNTPLRNALSPSQLPLAEAEKGPDPFSTPPEANPPTSPTDYPPQDLDELTSEQMVTLRTLYNLKAEITAVIERMRAGQVDNNTGDDRSTRGPPSYASVGA